MSNEPKAIPKGNTEEDKMWCAIFTDVNDNVEVTTVHGYFPTLEDAMQWAYAHDGHDSMKFGEFKAIDHARKRPAWIK